MEMINHSEETGITEHTYTLNDEGGVVIYKEWISDSKGKCIDSELRDKDGNSLDDPGLVDRIQEFLDVNGY
jgi:hypothetical protein